MHRGVFPSFFLKKNSKVVELTLQLKTTKAICERVLVFSIGFVNFWFYHGQLGNLKFFLKLLTSAPFKWCMRDSAAVKVLLLSWYVRDSAAVKVLLLSWLCEQCIILFSAV